MKKKLFSNMTVGLLAQIVAVLSGFVLPRLILERYGSEVNGLTQSIKQFLGIINFLDMGVGQVVRSALYRPLAQKDSRQISRIMSSGGKFYRRLAYALAGYVGVLIFVYPLVVDSSFGWEYTALMIAVMAIGSFCQYYFGIIHEQLLHADQKSYLIYGMQILTTLANLAGCVWMIRAGCSIHAVKLMTALVFLLRPVVYVLYVRRHYSIDKKIEYTEEPIKQKWNGIAQHVSAVVLDGTDNIVLTLFSTLSNVSVYSVYYFVISSIQNLYQSAAVGIQSAAGAVWAGNDTAAIKKMFSWVELGLHFATVLLFTCVGVLIVPFVRVYTDGLTDAQYIQPLFAALLTVAYGIRCLRTPYNIWILASGHFKQTQRCHIVAAALNLVLSILAVSRWGLVGIAVGTLIAMVYQTLWMAVYAAKKLLSISLAHIAGQFALDALAAGVSVVAVSRVSLETVSYLGWFMMAVKVGLISLVVIGLVMALFRFRLLKALVSARR